MAEFLGIYSNNNLPDELKASGNIFAHLEDFKQIHYKVTSFSSAHHNLWVFDHNETPDYYTNSTHSLYVVGNCYLRIAEASSIKKKKLSAADLFTLYQQYGNGFTKYIKGAFAVITSDVTNGTVKVFNAPLNLRNIFYATIQDKLLVTSSLGAAINWLRQQNQSVTIDSRAILDFYLFDFILDDHTFIQQVKELPSGHLLQFNNHKLQVINTFHSFSYFNLSGASVNKKEGIDRLKTVLTKNIEAYNEGSAHTAVALTGGFDSRSILALMPDQPTDYQFYSYGKSGSWDLKIPQQIAKRVQLNYSPIPLEAAYEQAFPEYARLAVLLSDGNAEFTHANIAYVYAQFLQDKTSILTGLLGSELIKAPSNRGLFIDENIIQLLHSDSPKDTAYQILKNQEASLPVKDKAVWEELIEMIGNHPYINNKLPLNEKYFHYLLMIGIQRYFRKEIKIQSPWKQNLHPFFDLDFIETLLTTPFPWVYNFSLEKNLIANISIHQVYGAMIHAKPVLSNIISTHAYRPRFVQSYFYLPLLTAEYFYYKNKIRKGPQLSFQNQLARNLIHDNKNNWFGGNGHVSYLFDKEQHDTKNFLKLSSLQYWLHSFNLSLY